MSDATVSSLPAPDADAELIHLCERHIANVLAYNEGPDRYPDDPDPLGDALDATRTAIFQTSPKTIAGLVAKARLAAQQAEIDLCGDDWGYSDAGTWAREIALDLLRLYGAAPPASHEPTQPPRLHRGGFPSTESDRRLDCGPRYGYLPNH